MSGLRVKVAKSWKQSAPSAITLQSVKFDAYTGLGLLGSAVRVDWVDDYSQTGGAAETLRMAFAISGGYPPYTYTVTQTSLSSGMQVSMANSTTFPSTGTVQVERIIPLVTGSGERLIFPLHGGPNGFTALQVFSSEALGSTYVSEQSILVTDSNGNSVTWPSTVTLS